MKPIVKVALLIVIASFLLAFGQNPEAPKSGPEYTADSRLVFPERYREWIYLTSGIDMSYSPNRMADHSMFDNVFVNPESYREFQKTGTWPDKTMLVLEARGAESKGSINQSGHYQGTDVMGLEVHVKDEKRFAGGWAFFGFENPESPAKMVPTGAACYSCHEQHAAVDTTFVQFYPTLLEIAKRKGTLSSSYLKEAGTSRAK
jgi:Cytochrome P460